jgi:Carboxypeptidase regulatory-like domain
MIRRTHAAAVLLWALALAFAPGEARAQAVTGAISGRVTSPEGEPIAGAQITVRNQSVGLTRTAVTREDGRYRVPALQVGGPYSVTAGTIGRTAQTRSGLQVALGQDLQVDFELATQALVLEGVTVSATSNPVLSPSNKGVGTEISEEAVERLPTLNRNFTDFVRLAPQVSSTGPGLSGGGVNNRFNNIQIDGASENDLFGLGTTGQPGGQAQGKSISIESVKEYQILLSPFDVRQGNFAGLLVNAVTKSGTNDLDGSVYYYTRNEGLAREQDYINEYEQTQYGFSVGGPIIRDRLHFFLNPEWQQRTTPASGPYLGQPADAGSPVPTEAVVNEFIDILEDYGIEPGTPGLVDNENPLTNMFGRLDLQLPELGSRFVIRHNYGRAEDDNFSRSSTLFNLQGNGYFFESTKHSTVAQLFTTFTPDLYNELIVGFNTIRDSRTPNVRAPSITVDNGPQDLQAGGEVSSQGNTLDQDIFEITNNLSWQRGAHRFDIGAKNEWYHIDNFFAQNSFGTYVFNSLNDFRNGTPSRYTLAANPLDPTADLPHAVFDAAQFGGYIQDTWEPSDQLSVSAGLRADVPVLRDKPLYTALVEDVFDRRTDDVPSGNVQWSPRLGFNWDVTGDNTTQLRGGVGVFVGRPAFVMIGNAYQNNGTGIATLVCGSNGNGLVPPAFNPDPDNQPKQCGSGETVGNVIGAVNLLDHDLKFPATFRASLGFDREVAPGTVLTFEGLYTRAAEQFFYQDVNLANPGGVNTDLRGRTVFGTIAASGVATAQRVDTRFTQVIDVMNQSKDWAYNLTAGVQRRFNEGLELRAFYTYSKVRDVISATSSTAGSQYRFGRVLAGPHTSQNVGISSFDQPHKIIVSGIYNFPWERFATSLSVIYNGQSGDPFTYVYGGSSGRGDLNADGLQGNDAIYVPTNALDPNQILFRDITTTTNNVTTVQYTAAQQAAAFEQFIGDSKCLREHRGEILDRNTCRNGWVNFVNVSLRQAVPTLRGQNFSVQLDVFNFLNLLNEDWGVVRSASGLSTLNLLTHVASTNADVRISQPIVQFNPTFQQFLTESLSSNYQLQLSARYEF